MEKVTDQKNKGPASAAEVSKGAPNLCQEAKRQSGSAEATSQQTGGTAASPARVLYPQKDGLEGQRWTPAWKKQQWERYRQQASATNKTIKVPLYIYTVVLV